MLQIPNTEKGLPNAVNVQYSLKSMAVGSGKSSVGTGIVGMLRLGAFTSNPDRSGISMSIEGMDKLGTWRRSALSRVSGLGKANPDSWKKLKLSCESVSAWNRGNEKSGHRRDGNLS